MTYCALTQENLELARRLNQSSRKELRSLRTWTGKYDWAEQFLDIDGLVVADMAVEFVWGVL